MTKKTELAVVDATTHARALPEIGDGEQALADYLEVDLKAHPGALWARCKEDADAGTKTALRIGLRLLALKDASEHGEFATRMQEAGIGLRDGQNCMRLAQAYAAEGDARRREALLAMGKAKAVRLLGQIPRVREQVFESAELLTDLLDSSKREFEAELKKLKGELERVTNQAEAVASRQAVESQGFIISTSIPYPVSNVRREVAALYKQAELAIGSMGDMPANLLQLQDVKGVQPWVVPTANQMYTAMLSLHATLGAQLASLRETFALTDVSGEFAITDHAYYQPEEAVHVAKHFVALAEAHAERGAKRANQMANDQPAKKGAKRKDV